MGSESQSRTVIDWTARVRVEEHELGMSFSVLLFLGDNIPENPADWQTSSAFTGAHHVYTTRGPVQGGRPRGGVVEGFVHLNRAIAKKRGTSSPGSFEPSVVEPYLKKELDWRVQKVVSRHSTLEPCILKSPE